FEASVSTLTRMQELANKAAQDVQALNALSDHVTQKIGILEKQRETVDRAAAQATRLDELVWDLEARLRAANEHSKRIKKVQDSLTDLQDLHRSTEAQTADLKTQHDNAATRASEIMAQLNTAQGDIRDVTARFDVDRRAMELVNQRLAGFRTEL